MVYPVVAERVTASAASARYITPTLPTTTVVGDLIVVLLTMSNLDVTPGSTSTGWTVVVNYGGTSVGCTGIFAYKRATGSDALVIDNGASYTASAKWTSFRIVGAGRVFYSMVKGGSTAVANQDPALVSSTTPPTQDILWLVSRHSSASPATGAPQTPVPWTNFLAPAGSPAIDTAELSYNAASMDPGPWTNGATRYVAYTICIQPPDFPVIVTADTRTGRSTANATSIIPTLAANIAVGDLLIVAVAVDGVDPSPAVSSSPGWVRKANNWGGTVNPGVTGSVFMKTATGSDALTISLQSYSEQASWISYRITGASQATLVSASTYSNTAVANTDPPICTATAVQATTWLTIRCADTITTVATAIPATPAGWVNWVKSLGFDSAGTTIESVELKSAVASVDPGAWTSPAQKTVSFTLAIQPPALPVLLSGNPKYWTGSVWTQKSFKRWAGSVWEAKPVKTWTGSVWKTLT